jgi:hypothetical protein
MEEKKEEAEEIKEEGRHFKAERTHFRNTIVSALSFLLAIECALFVSSFFVEPLKSHLTAALITLSVLLVLEGLSIVIVLRLFSRILVLSDYEAGIEKLRRDAKIEKALKERDKRD